MSRTKGTSICGAFFLALCLLGCASNAPPPLPPNIHLPAATPADVVGLLQNAGSLRVMLTEDQVRQVAAWTATPPAKYTTHAQPPGDIADAVEHCNDNNFTIVDAGDVIGDTESECSTLGNLIAPAPDFDPNKFSLGAGSVAAEVADIRACALPQAIGILGGGCVPLSRVYEQRGDLDLALTVVQNAPKCQGTLKAEVDVAIIPGRDYSNRELNDCLTQQAEILRKLHRPQDERVVNTTLCNAADEYACELLAQLGVSVDMENVDKRQTALIAADEARADAYQAAAAQAQTQSDANTAAVVGAIQGLGSSNPNAIVNEANRQANRIVAQGAANDAARAQATLQRQQSVALATQPGSQVTQQPFISSPSPAPSPPIPSPAPAASPAAGPALASASGSPGANAAGCTDMTQFVTSTGRVNNPGDGDAVGFFTSHANIPLFVAYEFTRGGVPARDTAASITLQPGQTIGGELAGVWALTTGSSAVDSNPPKMSWLAYPQSEINAGKSCKVVW